MKGKDVNKGFYKVLTGGAIRLECPWVCPRSGKKCRLPQWPRSKRDPFSIFTLRYLLFFLVHKSLGKEIET